MPVRSEIGHVVTARDVHEMRVERLRLRIAIEPTLVDAQCAAEKSARSARVHDEAGTHAQRTASSRAAQRRGAVHVPLDRVERHLVE